MAKNDKAKAKDDAKPAKKAMPTPPKRGPADGEVGVDYLAKKLGIEPATVRMKLRNAGIEKGDGGAYSWPEAKADKIATQISSDKDDKPAAKGKDDAKADKKTAGKKK